MYQDKLKRMRVQESQKTVTLDEDINIFLSHCKLVASMHWPINLYSSIFNEHSITLKVGAEEMLLSALHTLEPEQEMCVLKLYKDKLPWNSICDELDINIVELDEYICRGIRKLRNSLNSKVLTQFTVFAQSDSDNESIAIGDKLKKAAIQLIKESDISKEEITLVFLQKNLKISFKRTVALKEYLDKSL